MTLLSNLENLELQSQVRSKHKITNCATAAWSRLIGLRTEKARSRSHQKESRAKVKATAEGKDCRLMMLRMSLGGEWFC